MMGLLTMDMSSYEVRQNDPAATEYNEEVLCAGWIPTSALYQSRPQDFENRSAMPENLVNIDAELFLRKMYAFQR